MNKLLEKEFDSAALRIVLIFCSGFFFIFFVGFFPPPINPIAKKKKDHVFLCIRFLNNPGTELLKVSSC